MEPPALVALALLLLSGKSKASLLTFTPTTQIVFYEHTIINQVKIITKFWPIEPSFYADTERILQNKSETASADDKLYIDSCIVMLWQIRDIYADKWVPSEIFSETPEDMITKTVEYVSENFIKPNRLPITQLLEKATIDYDVLSFNLFRFKTLVQDSYAKYLAIINGDVSLSVVKDTFAKQFTFPADHLIKLQLISAGKQKDDIFAIYAMEFLSQPVTLQKFSVLEIANFTLPTTNLYEYDQQGVTFTGRAPLSPLNMVVNYAPQEWSDLHSDDMNKVLPFLEPTPPQPFSKNLAGKTKFSNNLSKINYTFPSMENFSPLVTAKAMAVQIKNMLLSFKSKKVGGDIQSNSKSDEELRNIIDRTFDFFPEEFQWILLITGTVIIVLIIAIITGIKCRHRHRNNRRKKRERAQLRSVNFLSVPLRPKSTA